MIPDHLVKELKLNRVYKYSYKSEAHKFVFKKLKGFSQGCTDRKLKYSMYEHMCKPLLDEKGIQILNKDGHVQFNKVE